MVAELEAREWGPSPTEGEAVLCQLTARPSRDGDVAFTESRDFPLPSGSPALRCASATTSGGTLTLGIAAQAPNAAGRVFYETQFAFGQGADMDFSVEVESARRADGHVLLSMDVVATEVSPTPVARSKVLVVWSEQLGRPVAAAVWTLGSGEPPPAWAGR